MAICTFCWQEHEGTVCPPVSRDLGPPKPPPVDDSLSWIVRTLGAIYDRQIDARTYLAGQALAGLRAYKGRADGDSHLAARYAVEDADALLAALAKPKGGG